MGTLGVPALADTATSDTVHAAGTLKMFPCGPISASARSAAALSAPILKLHVSVFRAAEDFPGVTAPAAIVVATWPAVVVTSPVSAGICDPLTPMLVVISVPADGKVTLLMSAPAPPRTFERVPAERSEADPLVATVASAGLFNIDAPPEAAFQSR